MAANLTQILNFKANFHQEVELFSRKKIYANNGEHFNNIKFVHIRPYNFKKSLVNSTSNFQVEREPVYHIEKKVAERPLNIEKAPPKGEIVAKGPSNSEKKPPMRRKT